MSSRKVKVIIGILAVVVLVMLAAAHSRKSNYSIVIPKVLTYPTTTLTFASKPAIVGSPSKAGGTYFKLTCQASSAPCLEATRGSGSQMGF